MTNDPYAHYEPQYPYGYYGYPPVPQPPAPQPPAPRRSRWRTGAAVAALTAAAVVGGVAIGQATADSTSGSGGSALLPIYPGNGNSGNSGNSGNPGIPGNLPNTGQGSGRSTSAGLATSAQQKGVVTVVSVLRYQNAESAGTGMVLTSNGEVLTNNHVVNGATSVTVTVSSTGKSYRADVVGTDPSDDVAVLQLRNASGLKTAKVGDASGVSVGDKVVGVGNAGGTGTLRASRGQVTALNQAITASDENGQQGERLTGLIQVDAPIVSGDSGGPLYDKQGDIVGMDTAASSDPTVTEAYAIPIENAVKIANEIEQGVETAKIHIGLPAFLGVGVGDGNVSGAEVTTLLDGGPAASAGITPGSVITKVGGTRVTSGDALKTALAKYHPGQHAKITWTDPSGSSHTATVALGTGPAD